MATTYDPLTLEALMQSLPELQKKKRRAESLRGVQKQLEKQAANAQARGPQNFVPQQQGGLFPTVQQFQPDYGQATQQGIGALGSYLTGRQAEQAEGGFDEAQSQAVLQAAQQGGQPIDPAGIGTGLEATDGQQQGTTPNDAALRAYMTMIGGPELAKSLGTREDQDQVHSTFEDDKGEKFLVMKSGDVRGTGKSANFGGRVVTDEKTGYRYIAVDKGAMRGKYIPLDVDTPYTGAPPEATGKVPANTTSGGPTAQGFENIIAPLLEREGGLNPNDAGRGPSNFGINQTANPEVDVTKLTPEQATQIYKTKYWDAIDGDNVPPAIQEAAFDAAVNMGQDVAKELIEESGGDPMKFRELREKRYDQIYDPSRHTPADRASWTKRNAETTGGRPAPDGAASTDPRALTQMEKDQSKADVKARAAAKASRGKIKDLSQPSVEAVDLLLKHPALNKVLAGGTGSFVGALGAPGGDRDELGIIEKLARPGYAKYDPEGADALALMDQVLAGPFAVGFQSLTGQGAGSVSNTEGQSIKNAISSMSTAQSVPAFKAAAARYKKLIQDIDARLARVERGEEEPGEETQTLSPPRVGTKPKYNLPPGFSIED